ncbi:MAG TPA: hypothetical protein VFT22_45965 [Kofleriaceae bacterium]|nr:hypothetical protein [Kofleriaceae bacterium]
MLDANDINSSPVATPAPQRLTWDEICQRYPDTWVVAVDSQRIEPMEDVDEVSIEFCSAIVIAYHKNRKQLSPFIKAVQDQYEDLGTYFTGPLVPTGTSWVSWASR